MIQRIHRLCVLLACLAGVACAPADPAEGGPEWPPPTELGDERPAALRVPVAYDGTEELPLVVLLGGYWNLASDLDDWLGVSESVDTQGFFLLMPDGTTDPDGAPFWNATDTCCDDFGSGIDDAGYLGGLIEEAGARLAVDATRVTMLGHSNGGFMAYRMACEPDSPVTALVSIAGSSWLDADDCAANRPVSVLQVHGVLDDVMPIDGDEYAPGALEVLGRWADRDGCSGDLVDEPVRREYADDGLDDETTAASYAGCGEQDVALWSLDGNDHYPEFTPAFTTDAIAWLLGHPRP